MMEQIGFCSGIENYSRHIDGRAARRGAELPARLLPRRLPRRDRRVARHRAADRRDVRGRRLPQAHPRRARLPPAERARQPAAALGGVPRPASARRSTSRRRRAGTSSGVADGVVEQIIRPTGLIDPQVVVKPSKGQIDDLLEQIRIRSEKDERVLVTTLTKKMAEELTAFLGEAGVRVRYLHSDVDTLRRVELLTELRAGVFDVLVGINLLREGLDLPEVSLVAILDADKEGFLRSVDVAHPDHRPRRPQRVGRGAHVRRQPHRLDEVRDRGDQPAPREAGRVQPGARRRPAAAAQAHRRHHRGPGPGGRGHRGAAAGTRRTQAVARRRTCGARASAPPARPSSRRSSPTSTSRCSRRPASSSSSSPPGCATSSPISRRNCARWRPRDTCADGRRAFVDSTLSVCQNLATRAREPPCRKPRRRSPFTRSPW